MPYSVIKVINGNYAIHAECQDMKQAKVSYHNICAAMWNDTTVPLIARIEIIDQALNRIDYEEIIKSEPAEE